MSSKIDRELLIADLRAVAEHLGHAPLVTEYERLGQYSPITIRKSLDAGWRSCLEIAGLTPTIDHRTLWSNEDLEDELSRLRETLGRDPTFVDIKQYSNISYDTFTRRVDRRKIVAPADPPLNPAWSLEAIDPVLGGWIAGFVCGEGSFIVSMTTTEFRVGVRNDDRETLELIAVTLDLPVPVRTYKNTLRRSRGEKVGDEARLSVPNRRVCRARVVPFFDRFPVRGRKGLDFQIFREAILFLSQRDDNGAYHQRFTEHEKATLRDLTERIQALRRDPSTKES